MAGTEGIVLGLVHLGESAKAARLADGRHLVAAARQDLVRVRLVSHVEDEFVHRRVENVMQRDRELHDAEARAEVSTGLRHRPHHLFANLTIRKRERNSRGHANVHHHSGQRYSVSHSIDTSYW